MLQEVFLFIYILFAVTHSGTVLYSVVTPWWGGGEMPGGEALTYSPWWRCARGAENTNVTNAWLCQELDTDAFESFTRVGLGSGGSGECTISATQQRDKIYAVRGIVVTTGAVSAFSAFVALILAFAGKSLQQSGDDESGSGKRNKDKVVGGTDAFGGRRPRKYIFSVVGPWSASFLFVLALISTAFAAVSIAISIKTFKDYLYCGGDVCSYLETIYSGKCTVTFYNSAYVFFVPTILPIINVFIGIFFICVSCGSCLTAKEKGKLRNARRAEKEARTRLAAARSQGGQGASSSSSSSSSSPSVERRAGSGGREMMPIPPHQGGQRPPPQPGTYPPPNVQPSSQSQGGRAEGMGQQRHGGSPSRPTRISPTTASPRIHHTNNSRADSPPISPRERGGRESQYSRPVSPSAHGGPSYGDNGNAAPPPSPPSVPGRSHSPSQYSTTQRQQQQHTNNAALYDRRDGDDWGSPHRRGGGERESQMRGGSRGRDEGNSRYFAPSDVRRERDHSPGAVATPHSDRRDSLRHPRFPTVSSGGAGGLSPRSSSPPNVFGGARRTGSPSAPLPMGPQYVTSNVLRSGGGGPSSPPSAFTSPRGPPQIDAAALSSARRRGRSASPGGNPVAASPPPFTGGGRRHADAMAGAPPPDGYEPPADGDWVWDLDSQMFWSQREYLFLNPKDGHFFDPNSHHWYNPDTETWYPSHASD